MSTIETVKFFAEIAVITGVFVAIITFVVDFRKQRKISQLTLFADYTKRYQEILLHLPENLTDDTVLTDEQKRYLRAYFDLCSEEYFLHTKKHLDGKVWEEWKVGMKVAFSKQVIVNYWRAKAKSPYEDFNKFVESDLIADVYKI